MLHGPGGHKEQGSYGVGVEGGQKSQPSGLPGLFLEANDNLMGRKTWAALKFKHNSSPPPAPPSPTEPRARFWSLLLMF